MVVYLQLGKLQGTSDDLQNKLKDSPALENLPKSFENLSKVSFTNARFYYCKTVNVTGYYT